MKKIITVIIAAAVLFGCIFAAGCVSEQSTIEPAYSVTVTTAGYDTYSTGEIFALEFESNPSTGYMWYIIEGEDIPCKELKRANLQLVGEAVPGASTKQMFWIQPEKAGDYKITLKYMRSWEDEKDALSTYTQNIHVVDSDELSVNGAKTQYVFDSFAINPEAGEFVKIIKKANPTTGYYWSAAENGLTVKEEYIVDDANLAGSSGQYEWYVTADKAGDYIFKAVLKHAGADEELSYFEIPLKFL